MNGIDIFSGAGGMAEGFKKAGFSFQIANEIDSEISNTYEKNHCNTIMINKDIKYICEDIEQCVAEKLCIDKKKVHIKNVDIVIGGPPCQGFSMAGARIRSKNSTLDDERNYLFRYYFQILQKFEPSFFVFENVKGLTNIQNGSIYNIIKKLFNDESNFSKGKYYLYSKILNAEDFGVPQKRERLIIIGTKYKNINFDYYIKLAKEQMSLEDADRFSLKTVRDAISDLSFLNSNEGAFSQKYIINPQTEYQRKRRNSNLLYNHKSTNHSKLALDRIKKIKPGDNFTNLNENIKSIHSGSYGRLEWELPSPTITTRFDTPSAGRVIHPDLHRALTPREAARIQSFDDSYIFYGNKTSIGKQIGNAVPPLLAETIGRAILLVESKMKNL